FPKQLDRIIIRNTFHHFTEKDAMIQSIITALKPEGVVCVKEFFSTVPSSQSCPLRMPPEEIISYFEQNNMVLIDSMRSHFTTYLKFQLSAD
ncbi:MAG: hypothetical protein AAGJ93_06320, partial [Bacteroidota bacterium]